MHGYTYIHHINITILFLLYTSSTQFGRPAGSDPSRLTQYLLPKGACYKTIRVTKRYMLQNNMCKTTVGITKWFTYKTICVTKWYITKQYMLLNYTLFILYYECTKPRIIGTFVWPNLILPNPLIGGILYMYGVWHKNSTNPWISWAFVLT